MKVDLNTEVKLNPQSGESSPLKKIILNAVFASPSSVIQKDKARELFKKIDKAEGELNMKTEEWALVKKCVDAGYISGVAWQVEDIIEAAGNK